MPNEGCAVYGCINFDCLLILHWQQGSCHGSEDLSFLNGLCIRSTLLWCAKQKNEACIPSLFCIVVSNRRDTYMLAFVSGLQCMLDSTAGMLSMNQELLCLQALKQLDAAHQVCMAADPGKAASASSMFLQDVLLRRLADDEPAVATTVLSLPSLTGVPGTELYAALAAVIKVSTHVLRTAGRRSEHKAWRAVARKVQQAVNSL